MFLFPGFEYFHLIWQNLQACPQPPAQPKPRGPVQAQPKEFGPDLPWRKLSPRSLLALVLLGSLVCCCRPKSFLWLDWGDWKGLSAVWAHHLGGPYSIYLPQQTTLAKHDILYYVQSLFRHLVLNCRYVLRSNSCLGKLESYLDIRTEILTLAFGRASVTWQWYFMQQDLNKRMKLNIFNFSLKGQ